MKYKLFKQIPSFSGIVDVMIKGLEKEWVIVDMATYGGVKNDICIGCAATNTLCQLAGKTIPASKVASAAERAEWFNYGVSASEICTFERAINRLRSGRLDSFLYILQEISHIFSFKLPEEELIMYQLSFLDNSNWRKELDDYKEYSKWLKVKGL